jgi:hypothetical protein
MVMVCTNGKTGIVMKVNGGIHSDTDRVLIFLQTEMSLLVNTYMVKHKATGNIDGPTAIHIVVHLLKEEKKARVFGKSRDSRNLPINMKEIMLMIKNMVLVSFIGRQAVTFLASINMM